MGTRYHITLEDMQKLQIAGVAIIGEIEPFYKQAYNQDWDEMQDTDEVDFYVHNGSVGKWQFNGYSENGITKKGMLYSGCNWGKADLDEIFEQNGIEPTYG